MNRQQHINYTLADIEQYLQGKLSPAEMHALEKAALQDPFLADAIEGYQQSGTPLAQQHLAAIRAALLTEDTTVRPITVLRRSTQWTRIAAMLILVIGAGTLGWYLLSNTGDNQDLAKQQQSDSASLPSPRIPAATDTKNQPVLNSVATDRAKEKSKGDIATRVPEQLRQDAAIAAQKNLSDKSAEKTAARMADLSRLADQKAALASNQPGITQLGQLSNLSVAATISSATLSGIERSTYTSSLTGVQQPSAAAAMPPPPIKDMVTANTTLAGKVAGVDVAPIRIRGAATNPANNITKLHAFSGRITDSAGRPIAHASVLVNNTNKGAATDDNGNFMFLAQDSVPKIEITAVGFESREQKLTASTDNNFVLKASGNELKEVVVTGYGTQRRRDITGSVSVIDPKKLQLEEISPSNGWPEFNKNLSAKTADARSKSLAGVFTGTIEAELDLNRRGKVTAVTILSSFNASLNETITQAIKDGPRWLLANGKPATGKKRVKINL